ncbi:MAG: spondin domain-containing protein [Actinomycetota bacterium]|nr:spondin domain-containing protein [Actinomycetota bacterium]
MKRFVTLAAVALVTAGLLTVSAAADDGGRKVWQVTIENLTPLGPGAPGSQPLSPPLFVVHSKTADVWSVGEIASHPVAAIAEDANNAPAESALADLRGVRGVFTGADGPIPSGTSRTYMVETKSKFNRLSLVTMLVNTNDAFTGLDSYHLRGHGAVLMRMAYDAGSERNNELAAFIPGPCCGHPLVRDPEGAFIQMHPGIEGIGDLDPAVYGWEGPVARITIRRVS